ncbi:RNA polymerase sigma factor [Planctomycetota bacterium]
MRELQVDFSGASGDQAPGRSSQIRPIDVFLAHRERFRRVAAGVGLGGADIEDCLQDVSVVALKQAKNLATQEDCLRWLTRVAVNRCLIEHRRRRGFLSKAAEIYRRQRKPQPVSAAHAAVAIEELERVRLGLQVLEDTHLAPLVLRYFSDMDATEIGQVLELKPSTVRSRLREARLKLAHELLKKGVKS